MGKLRKLRFYAVEKLTLIYILITFIVGLYFTILAHFPVWHLLFIRIIITALILALSYLSSLKKNKFILFSRFLLIGGLLTYWYPETFEFNRYLTNHDQIFAHLDQTLFGCQPSLIFNVKFPQRVFSEMMNLGYFSYFPIIIFTNLYFYLYDRRFFHPFFFTVLFSFLAFYLFFILYPASGPQYYFAIIGKQNADSGIFPVIGNYFLTHDVAPLRQQAGFFDMLVNITQHIGERPTAAFPSSHVGISTLIMFMLIKYRKYVLAASLVPLYIALIFATVYIQAHYVVDVLAGFLCAFLLFYAGRMVYKYLS